MNSRYPSDTVWRVRTPPCHLEESGILYQSDFRDVATDLPEESIDLIVTDPPYGINYRGCRFTRDNNTHNNTQSKRLSVSPMINDGYYDALNIVESFIRHASRILKVGSCLCCCCPGGGRHSRVFTAWTRLMNEHLRLKEVVVWDKEQLGPGGHYRKGYELILIATKPGGRCRWNGGRSTSNIFRHPRASRRAGDHPTPKPEALMSHFIKLHSDIGDIVMDPFAGHGTTLVAAKGLHRKYLGIEIVPEYCSATAGRLSETAAGGLVRMSRLES